MERRLLFVIAEDWYFWSHRLPLARAALRAGYAVALATRTAHHVEAIEREGIAVIPLRHLLRGSFNPLREAAAVWELVEAYRAFRPSLIHHVAIKPVLYGTLAARVARIPAVINALGGLGYTLSSTTRKARWLRPAVLAALRFALGSRHGVLIVQNAADAATVLENGLVERERLIVIRGSGVDIERFAPTPEGSGPPLVVLPARMLWDKGVGEFAAAARMLRDRCVEARFALVGEPDPQNPRVVTRDQLDAWVRDGRLEWWGFRPDMPDVLSKAHVVCLPSYHEGLPKSLLEAAACARPIVASDIPGCREIAREGINALLVPVGDARSLARALERLIGDAGLRRTFGVAGRRIVEQEFTDDRIAQQTLALYDRVTVAAGGYNAKSQSPPTDR